MAPDRIRDNKGLKVLLDTNFLLIGHNQKVDVFAEIGRVIPQNHQIVTLSCVLDELRGLVGETEDGVAAKVGLTLLKEKGVDVIECAGPVDDSIVELAGGGGYIVATNDQGLKARLRRKGIKVITLRGQDHLELA